MRTFVGLRSYENPILHTVSWKYIMKNRVIQVDEPKLKYIHFFVFGNLQFLETNANL